MFLSEYQLFSEFYLRYLKNIKDYKAMKEFIKKKVFIEELSNKS